MEAVLSVIVEFESVLDLTDFFPAISPSLSMSRKALVGKTSGAVVRRSGLMSSKSAKSGRSLLDSGQRKQPEYLKDKGSPILRPVPIVPNVQAQPEADQPLAELLHAPFKSWRDKSRSLLC